MGKTQSITSSPITVFQFNIREPRSQGLSPDSSILRTAKVLVACRSLFEGILFCRVVLVWFSAKPPVIVESCDNDNPSPAIKPRVIVELGGNDNLSPALFDSPTVVFGGRVDDAPGTAIVESCDNDNPSPGCLTVPRGYVIS
jgi:hypothetical protein